MVTPKPYTEVVENDYLIREFQESTNSEELVWHRDETDRAVTILKGEGWKLQMDNELPREMMIGETYLIPAMEYHRLIKGKGNLVIQIEEK